MDAAQFAPARRDPAFREQLAPRGELLVGYVGRLAPEKHVERLAALAGLDGVRLVVVGDGPARPRLERLLPGATFLGMLTGAELAAAYATLDVFVHTGPFETFGQAVQEAMASGVPVVATRRGRPARPGAARPHRLPGPARRRRTRCAPPSCACGTTPCCGTPSAPPRAGRCAGAPGRRSATSCCSTTRPSPHDRRRRRWREGVRIVQLANFYGPAPAACAPPCTTSATDTRPPAHPSSSSPVPGTRRRCSPGGVQRITLPGPRIPGTGGYRLLAPSRSSGCWPTCTRTASRSPTGSPLRRLGRWAARRACPAR